jgi:hypothetical protein
MAEVASKLARYNGWDVQLLTAVKQPPAETKPEKASASLGAVPVFTAKKDPTPELNAHKVTAKAAAKPVEPKKRGVQDRQGDQLGGCDQAGAQL